MKSPVATLPEALQRHLSAAGDDKVVTTQEYVEVGGDLCTPAAGESLRRLMPSLRSKLLDLDEHGRLREGVVLLANYFSEMMAERRSGSRTLREVTFALLYFIKGSDRIPDSIPEVGLVDDALIVQHVLVRHASVLRAHWIQRGRVWPAHLDALPGGGHP